MVTDVIRDRARVVRGAGAAAAERLGAVERSLTIERPAEDLYRQWRDPQVMKQVMAHLGVVTPAGEGRLHWLMVNPTGQVVEWDTQLVEDRPGEVIRWATANGPIPNEGSVRFHAAPGDRGTVVTLCLRFSPQSGPIGDIAARLGKNFNLRNLTGTALRRFKSLAETGEIPTTHRQPSGRGAGRDE
ncbi:MAG: SRPBCC family protein [Pseudomonadota bacterium]|nr:SRPBCC family protein [Pseudomonadota bacterium]